MAVILPLQGIRYASARTVDLTQLVAPPYDVVDEAGRDLLVSQNPHNILALELPKADPPGGPETAKYACAKRLYDAWLSEKILVRDKEPAVYPYTICFSVNGLSFQRKGFIALVGIESWESRVVRPHEQTFNKVTEDRLKLLRSTEAQFSQVFALYRHSDEAASILTETKQEEISALTDDYGNSHTLSRITDKQALRALHQALSQSILYIADGHHRYTTALKYRTDMEARCGRNPRKAFNYLMTYLVDAEDPGLMVLPTHRIVAAPAGLDLTSVRTAALQLFDREEIPGAQAMEPDRLSARMSQALSASPDRRGLGVFSGADRKAEIWWLRENAASEYAAERLPGALAELDVVLLEEAVLKRIYRIDPHSLVAGETVRYSAEGGEALRNTRPGETLFFLRPTPVNQVLDIADAGLTMPHKSTFFYPKILTGLVMNAVNSNGTVQIFD
jgi:uncharacterized protein (DUF1015 family)